MRLLCPICQEITDIGRQRWLGRSELPVQCPPCGARLLLKREKRRVWPTLDPSPPEPLFTDEDKAEDELPSLPETEVEAGVQDEGEWFEDDRFVAAAADHDLAPLPDEDLLPESASHAEPDLEPGPGPELDLEPFPESSTVTDAPPEAIASSLPEVAADSVATADTATTAVDVPQPASASASAPTPPSAVRTTRPLAPLPARSDVPAANASLRKANSFWSDDPSFQPELPAPVAPPAPGPESDLLTGAKLDLPLTQQTRKVVDDQLLRDMSVMFRLQTSHRKRDALVWYVVGAVLLGLAVWGFAQWVG